MSLLDNLSKVSYTSSLLNDKILGKPFSGSFNVGASSLPGSAGNIATVSIPQSFGADVLPIMRFSHNNSDWQEAGASVYLGNPLTDPFITASCYATATDLVILGQNWSGSTITIFYEAVLTYEE